jgi:asparagine synthase (glutamine-hydrolysing)
MPEIFGILNPTLEPGLIERVEHNLSQKRLRKLDGTGPAIFLAVGPNCGEIYKNPGERKSTILIRGHFPFADNPDLPGESSSRQTSQSKIPAPENLNGPFTHIDYGSSATQQSISVDRFGQHRVVYCHAGNGELVFASDIEILLCHPSVETRIDPQAIYHYLFFHVVPSPGSMYQGINKLPPAHKLEFDGRNTNVRRYWAPHFATTLNGTLDENKGAVVPMVKAAVDRCGVSQETGAFLSGGLDSSTVCGALQSLANKPAQAFSVGFAAEGYDEIKFAEAAAKKFGLDHKVHYITPQEVTDTVPLVAKAYDEPFGNSSAVPTYVCARFAKANGIRLLLGGDGGDEIFSGNTRYLKQKVFQTYYSLPKLVRTGLLEPLFASGNGSSRIGYGPLRKISRYIDQALVPLPDRLESFNLLRMVALDQILNVDFLDTIDSDMPIELLRQEWQALDGANYQDQLLFLDWKFTLADNDLRKVTEMTNLAGVEVAYPLLDNDIVEFAASIPASVRMPNGRLRHFYKESVKSFLPAETLTKSKHGFGLPFGVWARTDPGLREITKDSLSDFRQRRILTASFLDKLERQHMEDHADFYGNMVWVIMMLELWMQAHDASV